MSIERYCKAIIRCAAPEVFDLLKIETIDVTAVESVDVPEIGLIAAYQRVVATTANYPIDIRKLCSPGRGRRAKIDRW